MSGRSSTTAGVYSRTNEVAIRAPDNPVWKHSEGYDRYIFKLNWQLRLGDNASLFEGSYVYKSKTIFRM